MNGATLKDEFHISYPACEYGVSKLLVEQLSGGGDELGVQSTTTLSRAAQRYFQKT